jgi:hypothetical protein
MKRYNNLSEIMNRPHFRSNASPKKVTCNDTGQTFPSCREAAEHFKIAQSSMSHHLHEKPGYEKVGGKTFKFADQ